MLPNLHRARWRIIHHEPARGAWNMAIDEAILEGVQRRESPPTLRLYAWEPACLSLGFAQTVKDVNLDALHSHGWEMVRRLTGGRAILHTDELTYSVIGPTEEPRLVGGVIESYQRLSKAMLHALELLSLPVIHQGPNGHHSRMENNPVCFEVPSDYEITLGGKKLVGSAQARRKGGVLQHGSLPLHGDIARITQTLQFESEAKRNEAADRVRAHAATVEEGLKRRVDWDEAAAAFAQGFAETLNIEFVAGDLTTDEITTAERLDAERYAHERWTERV
ncbi:MAG: lipoate--protein ligase family protein [Anaerolineales bacterium]